MKHNEVDGTNVANSATLILDAIRRTYIAVRNKEAGIAVRNKEAGINLSTRELVFIRDRILSISG